MTDAEIFLDIKRRRSWCDHAARELARRAVESEGDIAGTTDRIQPGRQTNLSDA
jgi:hypothetical protein